MSPPPADFAHSDADLLARFQQAKSHPNCSQLLGFEMLELDQAQQKVVVRFTGQAQFTNPMGNIQGGMLTAMLDEVMSVAGLVASGMTAAMPTLEMKTSFLRPALPGALIGIGRVVRLGKSIAFLEGELFDAANRLIAKASATAMPLAIESIRPQNPAAAQ